MTGASPQRWELALGDSGYPRLLAQTHDPPARLRGIGDPELLVPGLAVVGARKATPYGLWAAAYFGGYAGSVAVSVISGAAHGCDRAAQQAALDAGGPTVAVLAGGADVDYPPSSATLLRHARRDHVVVSEAPWGAEPQRWAFIRRNRIIAGLAAVVLVVEAGLPSGTFSTADFALDAGRDVLAVPGSIRSRESRGTNRLIRQGATPVCEVTELAQELTSRGLVPGSEDDTNARGRFAGAPGDTLRPEVADPIARALLADPMRPDDVAWHLGLDIRDVVVRIGRLEQAGIVGRYPDGRYGPPGPKRGGHGSCRGAARHSGGEPGEVT